jgi:hypothetical protein
MSQLVGPLLRSLTRWAENSQRTACRNAMVATTALAADRRERDETQEFIDSVLARRAHPAETAPPAVPDARFV